jgi:hypothetical protein
MYTSSRRQQELIEKFNQPKKLMLLDRSFFVTAFPFGTAFQEAWLKSKGALNPLYGFGFCCVLYAGA